MKIFTFSCKQNGKNVHIIEAWSNSFDHYQNTLNCKKWMKVIIGLHKGLRQRHVKLANTHTHTNPGAGKD